MLIGFLPESIQGAAQQVVPDCAKVTGADVCEKMYNVGKCIQDKNPGVSKQVHEKIIFPHQIN